MAVMARLASAFSSTLWLLMVTACIFLQATPADAASDPWRIDDLAVAADPSGDETIASISQPGRAADFEPVPDGFSGGYTRSVHWLRFTLHAPPVNADGKREMLLEMHPPYIDDLQIYVSRHDGDLFDVRRGGDLRPQSAKEITYRGYVYRFVFDDERPRIAYVRLQTHSSSVLIVKAWEPGQFLAKTSREYALFGVLLGLMLAGLLANIWHGLWRSESIYRRYIAYLLATLLNLLGINGLAGEFLLPEAPYWANQWVPLGIVLVAIFGTRFYMLALDIAHAAPWMRWVYRIQLWLAICCLPASFLGIYPEMIQALLSVSLVMLSTGAVRSIQLWRQGNGNGKVLLLAHLFALGGSFSAFPALLGLLPGQFWLIYGFQLRSVAALLVLQLMLANHVRAMQAQLTQASVNMEVAKTIAQQERAAYEHQRHFLAMLTHELKTPLSVIRMRLGASGPTQRMQDHAKRAVADIDAIVERCALVSQIDGGPSTVQRTPCQLNDLLREVRTLQQGEQRVAIQAAEGPIDLTVHSEPLLLRTILSNLIDNAIKYSPADTPVHIGVTHSPQSGRDGVCVRVENRIAIAGLPDPERVFEKYYRAPGAHHQSGSGLGLYIAKALTGQLGGALNYRTHNNLVIFDLWLPL